MDRERLYQLAAERLRKLAAQRAVVGWRGQMETCVFYATLILSILDHHQGKRVPTSLPLREDRLGRLAVQVDGAIGLELLTENDPRIHSVDFWLGALRRAEVVLKGFTKRTP